MLKLTEIVILWVYYTIPFGFSLIWHFLDITFQLLNYFVMPPLKKEGHIALHMSVGRSVGMSVSFNLVQLITQERFAPETSNLVCR